MPMYSDKTNAENRITVSDESKQSIVFGAQKIADSLLKHAAGASGKSLRVAMETWYGVPYQELTAVIRSSAEAAGLTVQCFDTVDMFQSVESIKQYKQPFITDDPGFGCVNMDGRLEDILDESKVEAMRDTLTSCKADLILLTGAGAMTQKLADLFQVNIFMDITREPMLWKMWDGKLIPFAFTAPDPDYAWKEYYYCDYYLLHFQKKYALEQMDYYIEGIAFDTLKMVPRKAYDEIMQTLVRYPIKQVKEFQPGPWGAYRYKDLFDVPGLGCNAWNRLASPELSVLIDVGAEQPLDVPLMSLMQYGEELCGAHLHTRYPDLFPMEIWLDDGYFPEPQPAERISMPIHNHPGSDYVKTHFNEPLGRYETYYIAEAV